MFTPKRNISRIEDSSSSEKRSVLTVKSSERNKTLLTPCRRVGLKRRSLGDILKKQILNSPIQDSCEKANEDVNSSTKISLASKCLTEQILQSNECLEGYLNSERTYGGCSNRCNNSVKTKRLRTDNKDKNVPDLESNGNTVTGLTSRPESVSLESLDCLATSVQEKKKMYKHILLSEIYDKKHNIKTLMELTEKWKQGCQSALLELHQLIRENGHMLTMTQLLAQFQIPHDLIGYSEDCEDFE